MARIYDERREDPFADLLHAVGNNLHFFIDPPHTDRRLGFLLQALLLLQEILPISYRLLNGRLPPWLCVCAVLAWTSYWGNLDRRWWLHVITAASLSPMAYRAFWPLRDSIAEDGIAAELALSGAAVTLSAMLLYSGILASLVSVFAPKSTPLPILPRLVKVGSGLEEDEDEDASSTPAYHYAQRPSWLSRIRPPMLKLSRYPVPDAEDPADYRRIQQQERLLQRQSWNELRACTSASAEAVQGIENNVAKDEEAGFTPEPSNGLPGEHSYFQDFMDEEPPGTPAWARIDRTPPTPLSAARLELFIAPLGPGPRVMEVQVLASWRPIGEWLCDATVDRDEKWTKVRETIDSWKETCRLLQAGRIARYNIGTSAENAEIVLGPMHLSMHDLRDFFESGLHGQEKRESASRDLERFGAEDIETLKDIAMELIRMAKDYPQNLLVATMARLAAKIKKAGDWWRKELEWIAAGILEHGRIETTDVRGESTTLFDVESSSKAACSIIDDWDRTCQRWEPMAVRRFRELVRAQHAEPTSRLAGMAREMLELRTLLGRSRAAGIRLIISERHQVQLIDVVSLLERREKQLGPLATKSQFNIMVTGIRQCEKILRRAQDTIPAYPFKNGHSEEHTASTTSVEADDPTVKAKAEFMAKILRLGKEASVDEAYAAAAAARAFNKANEFNVPAQDIESQQHQATASAHHLEPIQHSRRALRQRIGPWADQIHENPYAAATIERRRQEAAALLRETDAIDDRPHPSKARRRQGSDPIDRVFVPSDHEAVSDDHDVVPGDKRGLGETYAADERSDTLTYREDTRPLGRRWREREGVRKTKAALLSGELMGFEHLVAANKVLMEAQKELAARWVSAEAVEMDENLAAADGVEFALGEGETDASASVGGDEKGEVGEKGKRKGKGKKVEKGKKGKKNREDLKSSETAAAEENGRTSELNDRETPPPPPPPAVSDGLEDSDEEL